MKTNTHMLNLVTQILAATDPKEVIRLRALAITDLMSRGYRDLPAACKLDDALEFFMLPS